MTEIRMVGRGEWDGGELEKGKDREREKEQEVHIVRGRTFMKGLSFEPHSEQR